MFLVSLATIGNSHGLNAEPSLNRPKEQYALEKACCTTSSSDHRTLVDDAAPFQDLPLCPHTLDTPAGRDRFRIRDDRIEATQDKIAAHPSHICFRAMRDT